MSMVFRHFVVPLETIEIFLPIGRPIIYWPIILNLAPQNPGLPNISLVFGHFVVPLETTENFSPLGRPTIHWPIMLNLAPLNAG